MNNVIQFPKRNTWLEQNKADMRAMRDKVNQDYARLAWLEQENAILRAKLARLRGAK